MQAMEERFGRVHPEMKGYKPVPEHLLWLQSAFFRLHRRREVTETGGYRPISYEDMERFGQRVLKLPEDVMDFFMSAIEEIDEAVLSDYHAKKG